MLDLDAALDAGAPRASVPADQALLRAWQVARESALSVVAGLSEADLDRAPAPQEWTPRQQVAHLAEMEVVWLSWALQVAAAPGCQIGHRHQTPTAGIDRLSATDELLERLADARRASIEAIAGLAPDQWDHVGYHRWFGPMTTRQCLKAIYRHDRMHTEQMLQRPTTFTLPPLPDAAAQPGWFTVTRRVAWSETDPTGAYQFAQVLRYAEDAETALLRHAGVLSLLHPRLPRIYADASYATPAYFDQELDVDVALVRIGRSSLHYRFRVLRGPTICAEGRLGAAFVDESGQSHALPPLVRQRLAPHLRPELATPWG